MTTGMRVRNRGRRGDSMVALLFFTTITAALCAAISSVVGARVSLTRMSRDVMGAMDAAESGLSAARFELVGQKDPDADGVGTLAGTLDGGLYSVSCTPIDATHMRLVSTGRRGIARKSIESVVLVEEETWSPWMAAAFGDKSVVISGGTFTDAYDSTLGTYESQAVNVAPDGSLYGIADGDIGSNGDITMNGTGAAVHGAATPGPDGTVFYNGGSTIDDGTTPAEEKVILPPVDMSPVTDSNGNILASATNYSSFIKTAGVKISPTGDITISGGGKLTIPPGNWYINSIKSTGGGTVAIQGTTKLFVKHSIDLASGYLENPTKLPTMLQVFGCGDTSQFASDIVKLNAGAGLYAAVYAPKMDVTIAGGGAIWGSVVAGSIKNTGGSAFHYDKALAGSIIATTKMLVTEVTWQRAASPEGVLASY